MEAEESKIVENGESASGGGNYSGSNQKMFTLKKWNAVAMWSWDVECDTCAICRVQVMDACLRCQSESKVRTTIRGSQEWLPQGCIFL